MQKSLQALVERHACLRTLFFHQENDELMQNVYGYKDAYFESIDGSAWNENKLKRQVKAVYERPFILEKGPLMRTHLFTRSESDHVLLFTFHHIISDGWSLWMIIDELQKLYSAQKTGSKTSLPSILSSYADFVQWQSEMLNSSRGESLWNYWKNQLSGDLPVITLPIDHPRPVMQTFNGATYSFELDEELSEKIKNLAKAEGVTLFMLLLAAYEVLLYRYTGQEDILVSSATTGRTNRKFANVMGYFINLIVLRADFASNLTFKKFLNHTRETVLGAIKNQDYPFASLVKKLQIKRDSSYSPLVQTGFILQRPQQFSTLVDDAEKRINWGGLEIEVFGMGQEEGFYDLRLEVFETKESLLGELKYNTDLFNSDTITRIAGHFRTLMEEIVANSEQRIRELPLLTKEEKHQIIVEWNDTKADYPKDRCIHQLFEEHVEKDPYAVAVVFEEQKLTYSELNNRANQLAHYLQALGVKLETLVGICMERSLEMIIGLLGILKAGGAYVPLDPQYPKERLSFMMDDTQSPILLTQSKLIGSLPEHKAKVVCLDTSWDTVGKESEKNVNSDVKSDNLAYVIYTSGSTGKPKGVMLEHSGLCNVSSSQIKLFNVNPSSNVLQFSSLSFDAATFEFVMAMLSGATLCLGKREDLLPGPNLIQLLEDLNVTIVTLPPSALANLPYKDLLALRTITVAGELCSSKLVEHWAEGREFFNLYGPTEGTIWTTAAKCTSSDKKPPIGRPINNTQVYILDANLQLVPIGVPGELHIAGIGLARGYLNRIELTREKFIPNPFDHDEANSRLYKTGDLVRYLPDGNIEYLGRIDDQVKIRGFRIEPGEIEILLGKHLDVKEVVIIVREDQPGDKRLVAYLVPRREKTLNIGELRSFLKQKLADYMIPSAFLILEAMPLTPNGKVDRKALLAVDIELTRETEFVAPSTSTQKSIAKIWAEVLKIEKVGVQDNFFEIGGDSLLLVHVHSKLQKKLEMEFPIADLFQYPTIHSLSQHLSGGSNFQDFSQQLQIHTKARKSRKKSMNQQRKLRQRSRLTKPK
eukprot:CAMPEP_0201286064 /NCGR_PEP_ID=MMETSP1317-20130820/114215_1 /ASSEMBLY_ACC=CAM_ASM_000770 /TAXON_ID=187299 /ORGANISM="Undescribed Undescribed, Strain Undescribed" /LENGTH=1042 /DNA_ID=CAMNT_0047612527 /DNA_START=351 /DNA_END=3479 /DNA_ORIENTATION=+